MAACQPELLVPAHGLPIGGGVRIATVLDTVAGVLENLVDDVLEAMNSGAVLADIVSSVEVEERVLALPYLRPVYDEPEFVIRNIWRLYGGWWDGDPASLKPPGRNELAAAIADLAGGADAVADRAADSAAAGDLRLACQLIEYAVTADPTSNRNHEVRDVIYTQRRKVEKSLMAKGIYGATAAESELVHRGEATVKPTRISLGEPDVESD